MTALEEMVNLMRLLLLLGSAPPPPGTAPGHGETEGGESDDPENDTGEGTDEEPEEGDSPNPDFDPNEGDASGTNEEDPEAKGRLKTIDEKEREEAEAREPERPRDPDIPGVSDPEKQAPQGMNAGRDEGVMTRTELSELAVRNPERLEKIIGYMDEIESLIRKQISKRVNEQSDENPALTGFGNDLANVLPSELALLYQPETRTEFLRRYATHSLSLLYPPEHRRFPVVIMVDGSGSMRGKQYEIAVGFALAMVKLLRQERRGIVVMNFSSTVTQEAVITEGTAGNIWNVLRVLMTPNYGGTNFDAPLERAFLLKRFFKWRSALYMLITDGGCAFNNPEAIARAKGEHDKIVALITNGRENSYLRPTIDEIYNTDKNGMLLDLVKVGGSIL